MFHLSLYATVLVLISTFFGVTQANEYITYYLDDSPEITLGKEIRSVAKLVGFRENTYSLKENSTFISKVFITDSSGVVVTFETKLHSQNAPSDEITLQSKNSNFTFNTKDLIDDERTHIEFGASLIISYRCNSHIHAKVSFILTAFSTGRCNNKEFMCKNKLCVWKELRCDKKNNCGDDSDEDYLLAHCQGGVFFEFPGVLTIIIISLILLFLVSLITFFMINNWNRPRQDTDSETAQPDQPAPDQPDSDQQNSNQSDPLPSPSCDKPGGSNSGQGPQIPEEQVPTDEVASLSKSHTICVS